MNRTICIAVCAILAGCAASGGNQTGPQAQTNPAQAAQPVKAPTASKPPPAAPKDKLENVPLKWMPREASAPGDLVLAGASQVKLQVLPVTDVRTDKVLLGQNREKTPYRKFTTRDDVPAFVTLHMQQLFADTGVAIVDSGATRVMKTDLVKCYVDETDQYRGEVVLDVNLTDSSGKTVWSGITVGTATNFGRSYKDENYYETLSDALARAIYQLLLNPEFEHALVK